MPYKSESIKLKGLQDRRRRLTDENKSEIRDLYSTGLYSLNSLAKQYEVSKKTILLIVNPNSAEKAKEYRKDHWKEWQRTKEERTETIREYRQYKQSLYKNGELEK